MSRRISLLWGIALVVVSWNPAAAQSATAAPETTHSPVVVYTNEDLERLPPLPTLVIVDETGERLKIDGVEERWAFVESVVGQAYARIDADREYWMERRRTEAEADALERIQSRPRYLLPWNYFGREYVAERGRGLRPRQEPSRPWERPNARLFRSIIPIHARPTPSLDQLVGSRQSRGIGTHGQRR